MSRSVPLEKITALLQQALSGAAPAITARSPGAARDGVNGEQINLYLYHVFLDDHVNTPVNPAAGPLASLPPLDARLRYLVTAYSDGSDASGQEVLGRVIGILHDNPVLDVSRVEDLAQVTVMMETLSADELARLWASFQAECRLSIGFEVRVQLA
jgi:hypothetical protein